MKKIYVLLFVLLNGCVAMYANSLHSLVFNLSADLRTTLPANGWVTLSFTVVNYGEKELNVKFSAICLDSGKELPAYPQTETIVLKPNEEQLITVFMNAQCGQFASLPAGQHSRMIQYNFVETKTKEKLTFEQRYIIEV